MRRHSVVTLATASTGRQGTRALVAEVAAVLPARDPQCPRYRGDKSRA